MFIPRTLGLLCLAAVYARAQDSSSTTDSTATTTHSSHTSTASDNDNGFVFTNSFSTLSSVSPEAFTGTQYSYASPTGQTTVRTLTETLTASNGSVETVTTTSHVSSTNTQITASTSSVSLINIGGTAGNATATNGTHNASSTSSSVLPSNTVPCNGFPEFCNRKYSNITMVTAHNAAFAIKNNIASNQEFGIVTQLNDGVRMLSGEVHRANDTMYNCHTSCTLLNAGTFESEMTTLREWIEAHPYDVVTVLIVNSDFVWVENFTAPITNAGLLPYVYTPDYIPQYRDQWPTLGEMILRNQRVVFFMDYMANQASVPYILDEFTHMWETPFSPTDQSFPCTQQRPPNLSEEDARDKYMYLINHNLNTAVDLSSIGITISEELLVPNTAELNLTNGQGNEFGELGLMANNCTSTWGRPPNFLLVDYYNYGMPEPGSVFHVAADHNNVTYTQQCCGSTSGAQTPRASSVGLLIALGATVLLAW